MKIQYVVTFLLTMILSACGVDENIGGGPSISVVAVSGGQVSLDGTYSTGCRTKSGIDVIEGLVVNGSSWAYSRTSFASTNGTCTGGESPAAAGLGNLSAGSVSTISAWTEDNGVTPASAPTAGDLSGSLSNTEAFTSLTLTITAASGALGMAVNDVVDTFYIVDDTGPAIILYVRDSATTASPSGPFVKV